MNKVIFVTRMVNDENQEDTWVETYGTGFMLEPASPASYNGS